MHHQGLEISAPRQNHPAGAPGEGQTLSPLGTWTGPAPGRDDCLGSAAASPLLRKDGNDVSLARGSEEQASSVNGRAS